MSFFRMSFSIAAFSCLFLGACTDSIPNRSVAVGEEKNIPESSSPLQLISTSPNDWKQSLQDLQSGNNRFINDVKTKRSNTASRRLDVISEQNPKAVIVSCADSRIIPEMIFDQCIGDLFVVRSAGNVINGVLEESVEFATQSLKAPLIVVLGHEGCGAVKATLNGTAEQVGLTKVAEIIRPAIQPIMDMDLPEDERLKLAIIANARDAKYRLEGNTTIQNLIRSGNVRVVVAYYMMSTGDVTFYDVETLVKPPKDI